ncbi:aminotransferase class V-fold PLP-dependent enzyme [Luteimonas sp. XNQY3]|nr:aminotransferase class V-fold PLP-dependent enzyme [Luteimonas sp. XNQY3]
MIPQSVVYLNAGSFGPLPRSVYETVAGFRHELACDPAAFLLRRVPGLLWHARTCLADHVGCDAHRLAFSTSVSAAVSMIAASLELCTPGEILLSDQEYQTMRWCWERVAARTGLRLRTFGLPSGACTEDDLLDSAVREMRATTRLVFFSHVISGTGVILPAARICEQAQARGIVSVVDGAHAIGAIPVVLRDIPCDFYVGSCHKWLLAPSGSSFLYMGRAGEARLHPQTISWGDGPDRAAESPGQDVPDIHGSTPRLRRLECEGTRDICPWLAVPDAVAFHRAIGVNRMLAYRRTLAQDARARLEALKGVEAATGSATEATNGMMGFALPRGVAAGAVQRMLWEHYRIEVSVGGLGDRGMLRVAPHAYNTATDIAVLADGLERVLHALREP